MDKKVSYILKEQNETKIISMAVINGKVEYISPEKFLSPNEIVWDIIRNRLDKKSINYIKSASYSDINIEHLGFGMWIRNTYALWNENNPYTDFSNVNNDNHPDNLSFNIMLKVRTLLIEGAEDKNRFKNFDDAMKILGE